MPALAFSPLDVLLILGLGTAGFIVVALVCALVLAALHLVLPATDSGAEALDAETAGDGEPEEQADTA